MAGINHKEVGAKVVSDHRVEVDFGLPWDGRVTEGELGILNNSVSGFKSESVVKRSAVGGNEAIASEVASIFGIEADLVAAHEGRLHESSVAL